MNPTKEDIRQFSCPDCGARPGQHCSNSGVRRASSHQRRMQIAQLALNASQPRKRKKKKTSKERRVQKLQQVKRRYDLTEDLIDAAKTENGAWTRDQLAKWGVPHPPPKGWRRKLLGKDRSKLVDAEARVAEIRRLIDEGDQFSAADIQKSLDDQVAEAKKKNADRIRESQAQRQQDLCDVNRLHTEYRKAMPNGMISVEEPIKRAIAVAGYYGISIEKVSDDRKISYTLEQLKKVSSRRSEDLHREMDREAAKGL